MLCLNFQREFSEESAATAYEHGDAWGAAYTVSYMCCPVCGSGDITDEYHHCNRCGKACEYYTETEDGEYYCEECYTSKLKKEV